MASSFTRFLDHTQRRTTVGRTPLDEWSARRRDLYLKTHNTHNRQTSTSPLGLQPTISAAGRPQTYTLDRVATGTGNSNQCRGKKLMEVNLHYPHILLCRRQEQLYLYPLYLKIFLCIIVVINQLDAPNLQLYWDARSAKRQNFFLSPECITLYTQCHV